MCRYFTAGWCVLYGENRRYAYGPARPNAPRTPQARRPANGLEIITPSLQLYSFTKIG